MFDIQEDERSGVTIFRFVGDLVFGPPAQLVVDMVATRMLVTWQTFVCDLSKVEQMDSSGVAAVLRAQEQARQAGGHLIVLRPSRRVREVLTTAHLLPYMHIEEVEADAVRRALARDADRPGRAPR